MKILKIDIETMATLAWVWGLWNQNIPLSMIEEPGRMICLAAQWHGEREVMFLSEWGDGTEKMLQELWDLLNEADIVMHFNGKRFDMRHINREFLENDFLPPAPYKQIDLLRVYKKHFLSPSNKLDYIVQTLFNRHKLSTGGFKLWKGAVSGDVKCQKRMESYNKKDVRLLGPLYAKLLPWIDDHPNAALYSDSQTDRPTCPKCSSRKMQVNKTYQTSTGVYTLFRCGKCKGYARSRSQSLRTGSGILTNAKF